VHARARYSLGISSFPGLLALSCSCLFFVVSTFESCVCGQLF
jgi:hypothetical protein